ncbi:FAD-binding oxidoreductase [soil metagenome]
MAQQQYAISKSTADTSAMEALRTRLQGDLLFPRAPGYDSARSLWNGMIDRRPALIAQCLNTNDVRESINFARDHGLRLSIRGGGHNIAGMAVCDGGLMIDFSLMKNVEVDEASRRVRVQPGAVWGEVDQKTQAYGLAVPSGIISTTGVAGLTLGGGFGWLTRKHGHTADHLRSVTIVTADGNMRSASETEHSDLFWGLRGGGGNFGVVTEFEFEAREIGPTVAAGLILYPMDDAPDVIRFFREYTESAPEELTCLLVLRIAPPAPFLPESVHGKPVVGIAALYAGAPEEGAHVLAPLKSFGSPLADTISPKPYTTHQSFLDSGQPHGRHYYWKSEYLSAVSPDLGEVMIEHARRFTSPHSSMLAMHLGGATKRVSPNAGAVSHRDADYVVAIQGAWDEPETSDQHIGWARDFHAAIRPYSTGGVYVNFLTDDEGADRVRQAYEPDIYARLAQVKSAYDPMNLFRLNKNIAPSG